MTEQEQIQKAGFAFKVWNEGATLYFEKPINCMFFTKTGRWRTQSPRKIYSGGAERFLSWLKNKS